MKKAHHPLHCGWVSSHLLGAAQNRKVEEEKMACSPSAWVRSWNIHLLHAAHVVLRPLTLTRVHTLGPLISRPLNYSTSPRRSPACRWWTMGLLSLHSHMSQYLINLFPDVTSWFCFPGEPWLVHQAACWCCLCSPGLWYWGSDQMAATCPTSSLFPPWTPAPQRHLISVFSHSYTM